MKARLVERMIGGGGVWSLPDSQLEIMWMGPGSRLYIGTPRRPGGFVIPIEHPTADFDPGSMKAAQAAIDAFVAAAEEDSDAVLH